MTIIVSRSGPSVKIYLKLRIPKPGASFCSAENTDGLPPWAPYFIQAPISDPSFVESRSGLGQGLGPRAGSGQESLRVIITFTTHNRFPSTPRKLRCAICVADTDGLD